MGKYDLIMMNLEIYLRRLTKDELKRYVKDGVRNDVKKLELLEAARENIGNNEVMLARLYNDHVGIFALRPEKVEEMLEITKTERKRWEKEDRLKVVAYEEFNAYGKTMKCPMYDLLQINSLSKEMIEEWRQEHKEIVCKNKIKAIEKANKTKNINNQMRDEFKKEFRKSLASWYKVDERLAVSFELAFWTVWINRWAKENQVLALDAKGKKGYYEKQKEKMYQLKDEAIKLLIKSEFADVGFYRPVEHQKILIEKFCKNHYEEWCDEREWDYTSKWEFFDLHRCELLKCKDCCINIQNDYYSLYYISIQDDRIKDLKFSFHVPYSLGEDIFPRKEEVKWVEHEEQYGLFRFGRPLLGNEEIIYTEKFVLKKFNEALVKHRLYSSNV